MKSQIKIAGIGCIEPASATACVMAAIALAKFVIPLIAKKSATQELIYNLNEETQVLQDIVNGLMLKYSFIKEHFEPLIKTTIEQREAAKGRGRNPHEYDLNCLYRAVIQSAYAFEPQLQQLPLLDNINSKWACVDWNKPKNFSNYLPVVQSQMQSANSQNQTSQLTFKPNLLAVGIGIYLLSNILK